MEYFKPIAAAVAGASVFLGAIVAIIRYVPFLWNSVLTGAEAVVGLAHIRRMMPVMLKIGHDFEKNGGSSLRDTVDRIEKTVSTSIPAHLKKQDEAIDEIRQSTVGKALEEIDGLKKDHILLVNSMKDLKQDHDDRYSEILGIVRGMVDTGTRMMGVMDPDGQDAVRAARKFLEACNEDKP